MPVTTTKASPIIVRVTPRDPQNLIRFVWVVLAIGGDGKKRYGKAFPGKDGAPGQEFEWLGDPAALEDDPHLEIVSDPDDRVAQAIIARDQRVAAAKLAQAKVPSTTGRGRRAPGSPAAAMPVTAAPSKTT
jgi:hypothetical protein